MIRLAQAQVSSSAGRVEYTCGDVTEAVSADVRRHIAYVPQGNTLLSGTIADNLRFGDPAATEADMCDALGHAADSKEVVKVNGTNQQNMNAFDFSQNALDFKERLWKKIQSQMVTAPLEELEDDDLAWVNAAGMPVAPEDRDKFD